MADVPFLSVRSDGIVLNVYVQPGAKRSRFAGEYDARLKLQIASPPVDGKANKALRRFLAKALKLSPSCIQIIAGENQRRKRLFLKCEEPKHLVAALLKLAE